VSFDDFFKSAVRDVVREELRTALGTVGPQKVEGLLSLAETAKRAGVSPGTVKKWATEGLRVLGSGRMRRFQWPDVVEFLARQAKPAGKAVDPEERAAEILATLPKRKVR